MTENEPPVARIRQLVQSVRSGELRLVEVPVPEVGSTEVLVRTEHSMISAGTERGLRKLASANLLAKARARPDLVRKVIQKVKTDGISSTRTAIQARLEDEMPLGYSGAGTVVAVGDSVSGIRPGMRVATAGGGHGEMQVVPALLCAPIPEGVTSADASFATIAAIALHGIHRSEVEPGGEIVVLGLGLIGQIGLRLAMALGYRAVGLDVSEWAVKRARDAGFEAWVDDGEPATERLQRWSRIGGADGVLIMASTPTSDPIRRSPDLLRDRGTIVVVGDIGLELERRPLYDKELTIRLARSYGPGRYERSYEDWAVDYPPGFVRWTEGRNLSSVLGLLESRRIELSSLATHAFEFDSVRDAYALVEQAREPMLGVRLDYRTMTDDDAMADGSVTPSRSADLPRRRGEGLAFIGAGSFAAGVLLPGLRKAGFTDFVSVGSAAGISASRMAESGGFRKGVASREEILADPDVGVVVIASTHDKHAGFAAEALSAGCHVYCEKPLALDLESLRHVESAWEASDRVLYVGFNRRFSPAVGIVMDRMADLGPLNISYRINAGPVDPQHWYSDRRQGGRLLGEVCHFVDTCTALVNQPITRIVASSSFAGEAALAADFAVTLAFTDGSLAAITYASSGHPRTSKERIEILGGGHTVVIDDFRSVEFDGSQVWKGHQDKGHRQALLSFRQQVLRGESSAVGLDASRSVLSALDSSLGEPS